MKNFGERVNTQKITFAGDTITQTADIDLSSVCGTGNSWTPIGNVEVNGNLIFAGTYNGNDKTMELLGTVPKSSIVTSFTKTIEKVNQII